MTYVIARPGESFDALLLRFRRAMEAAGVLREYRARMRFTPNHERRREQLRRARRRARAATERD